MESASRRQDEEGVKMPTAADVVIQETSPEDTEDLGDLGLAEGAKVSDEETVYELESLWPPSLRLTSSPRAAAAAYIESKESIEAVKPIPLLLVDYSVDGDSTDGTFGNGPAADEPGEPGQDGQQEADRP